MSLQEGLQSKFIEPSLQKYGCYYFCLLKWAESLGAIFRDDAAILRTFERHLQNGWVEQDCFVVAPTQILNDIQFDNTFTQVCRMGIEPKEKNYLVYWKKPGYGHFTLMMDGVNWDPLDPNRPGKSDYKIDSYRRIV